MVTGLLVTKKLIEYNSNNLREKKWWRKEFGNWYWLTVEKTLRKLVKCTRRKRESITKPNKLRAYKSKLMKKNFLIM